MLLNMKNLEQQSEQDVDDSFTESIQETISFPNDLGDLNTGPAQPKLQVNISIKIK